MFDESRIMYYLACPECKKKVNEESAGFKCEKCNKTFNAPNPTYSFNVRVSDLSGNIYLSSKSKLLIVE
jgi:replication factor A1